VRWFVLAATIGLLLAPTALAERTATLHDAIGRWRTHPNGQETCWGDYIFATNQQGLVDFDHQSGDSVSEVPLVLARNLNPSRSLGVPIHRGEGSEDQDFSRTNTYSFEFNSAGELVISEHGEAPCVASLQSRDPWR
jgi:hypothetical protein